MQDIVTTLTDFLTIDRLLDLGIALLILIGGWIVAKLLGVDRRPPAQRRESRRGVSRRCPALNRLRSNNLPAH